MNKDYDTKQQCVFSLLNAEPRNITEISRETGISRSQLTKWKSGADVGVRADSIYKLATHLGYKVEFKADSISIHHTEDKTNQKTGGHKVDLNYLYDYIELLKEKNKRYKRDITLLDQQVKLLQIKTGNQPAFQFKTVSDHDHKTGKWSNHKVYGDTSCVGYTVQEYQALMLDHRAWHNRYHPDSFKRVNGKYSHEIIDWNKIDSSKFKKHYIHEYFDNLLWMGKHGKYVLFNVDVFYNHKLGYATCMYHHVNDLVDA